LASSLGWDGFPSVYRKLELEVEKLGYTVRWDSFILSISLPAPSCSVRQGSSKADRWKLLVRIISRRLARVGVGKDVMWSNQWKKWPRCWKFYLS